MMSSPSSKNTSEMPMNIYLPDDVFNIIKEYAGINTYSPRYFKNIPFIIDWKLKYTLGYNGDFEYDPKNPPTVTYDYKLDIIKRTPKCLKTSGGALLKIKKDEISEYIRCSNGYSVCIVRPDL